MKNIYLSLSFLIFTCSSFALLGQTVLFEENFNDCNLPAGWEVNLDGNPDAIWEISQPSNDDSDGSTIDGSCMLIFDDDATGNGSDAWNLQLESPSFNSVGWASIQFSMDVHFRNYNGSASLTISVFDGNSYEPIRRFQGADGSTGEQFSEFVTITADLSFYASENMSILIEYDDGNDWAWWAGIDNIRIVGEGTATPILLEDFNDCDFPEGWTTSSINGENTWQIGYTDNPNAGEISSMNGSCFAFFDDDGLTADAPFARTVLVSPPFSGLEYSNYYLDFDLILRRYSAQEHFAVGVYDENTQQIAWANSYFDNIGGPNFNVFEHQTLDISALRKPMMRLVFLYDDGNDWGWWVGIDNIKVTAEGVSNDLCTNAIQISIDDPCSIRTIENTLFTGVETDCADVNAGSTWYQFTPSMNQLVQVKTNAQHNDLLTVFQGDCDNLNLVDCSNYDEFAFEGEDEIIAVEAGQTYFVRISGIQGEFGLARGNHCLELTTINEYPPSPENDFCANAMSLEVGMNCLEGNNINATFNGPIPSRNDKSKADVWYRFVATQSDLKIRSNADFADVITVFEGNCNDLTEVACADLGRVLDLSDLSVGQEYWVQVSGYFATIEGNLCIQIEEVSDALAENSDCPSAFPLLMNDACTSVNNQGLSFSGLSSECAIYQGASVWFSIEVPASGQIQILAEAEFTHTISLFAGNCDNLEEVFCMNSTRACGDDPIINGLTVGDTYWIRVSSSADLVGVLETGELCIQVIDADGIEETTPLNVFESLECYDNGRAKLNYVILGGSGEYAIQGNGNGEILESGDSYFVLITDENGCETSITGIVDCENTCEIFVDATATGENECPSDLFGSIVLSIDGGIAPYTYLWSDGSTTADISDLASGYYTVTVMDSEGTCAAVAGGVIPGPSPFEFEVVKVINAGENFNDGSIAIDFSGGLSPYQFEWTLNGTTVSNDQNPEGLAPGAYDLLATDANGCTFEYENIVVEGPTSSIELVNTTTVNLYPNPTQGRAYLDWDAQEIQIKAISIRNASGQLLKELLLDNSVVTPYPIDLNNWPSGVYMVNCFTENGSFSRRLVKILE